MAFSLIEVKNQSAGQRILLLSRLAEADACRLAMRASSGFVP
jgi:hypothetical protein